MSEMFRFSVTPVLAKWSTSAMRPWSHMLVLEKSKLWHPWKKKATGSREKNGKEYHHSLGSNGTTLALGSWSENWTLMLRKKKIEKGEPDATVLIINKEEPIILPECI